MFNYIDKFGKIESLLNAKQVSEILNVSKPQVFLMMRRGDFPVVRMGKLVRVRRSDLEKFIQNQILSVRDPQNDSLRRNIEPKITGENRGER